MEQYINMEIRKGANLCFVHVSSRNRPKGKFDKYPVPDDASNIYLNSCAKDWYINGLPCWGKDFDASLLKLQELIATTGAKRVVFIGSSMGAFGAALFASHLHAELICFAPELHLNVYSGFSKGDNLSGNLPRLENMQGPKRALIFAGINSPSDVVCAEYFRSKWPDCKSYFFKQCGHGTARHLKDHALLNKVIDEFIHYIDVSELLEPLASPHEIFANYNFVEPAIFSDAFLNEYIQIVYCKLKLHDVLQICAHLRARGVVQSALKLVETAIDDHGPIAEMLFLKAQCLRRVGRHKDAIDAFMAVQTSPEYKKQALLGSSMIHKKLGQHENAHELYLQIITDIKKDLGLYLPLLNESNSTTPSLASSSETLLSEIRLDIQRFSNSCNPLSNKNEKITEIAYVDVIDINLKAIDFERATVAALDGFENFPNSTLIQSRYACIAQVEKNWPAAIDRLTKLLSMEGSDRSAETFSRLVQAYRNAKQFDQAEAVALKGLEQFSDSILIQSEYAWTAQTQKNWVAAVARLEKLLALQGTRAGDKTYVRLTQSYKNSGQLDNADAMLAEGLIKFPNSIRIKNECLASSASDAKSSLSGNVALKGKIAPSLVQSNLLLTTFPGHKSKNVGDNLISYSAIKMIALRNPDFKPIMAFREENLDHYADGTIRNIIAPGFSVSDGVYPKLFSLYSDLKRMPNFYPIGCSFQHTIPAHSTFEKYEYSKETLDFLHFLTVKSGPLPCRDQLIVELLQRHEIPAIYSGDLAIYDEGKINTTFVPPKTINSVVFTIQHHARYEAQSFGLLGLIKKRFPDAKLYVAFHSKAAPQPQKIADHAVALGFTELHLYGDVKNLDVYDNMDLHIGYRLHGHISFLRRRKPSVLLVEDARSYGLAHTPGTDVGCFEALSSTTLEADPAAAEKAMEFVDDQIRCHFHDYLRVFSFIDKTHADFIKPYFDDLALKIS